MKSVNILLTVRWVAKAGSIVKIEPFKMFQEGRYLRLFYGYDEEDPFLAADELALQDLMEKQQQ